MPLSYGSSLKCGMELVFPHNYELSVKQQYLMLVYQKIKGKLIASIVDSSFY